MSAERILVIDDSQDIADFLGYTVLPDLGYDSLVAYSGEAAFQLIQANHTNIDLILTDLQLPDVNGLELLRRMNKAGHSIPTIVFTAYGSEQIAVDAFRIGVQDYLNKPVEIGQLESAIERALEARRLRKDKERLTRELQEQVFWLRELMRVGQSLTSTLDVDEVLRRIVDAGVALTRADEGFIALLDEPGGQLYLRAAKNIDQDRIETTRIPITDSLVGSVLSSLRPLRSSRDDEDGLLKVTTGFLVYSMLHVPILSKGKALGVLSVDNRLSRRAFRETDETVLASLADYAAVALENANLYQQAQQEISNRRQVEEALLESEERYALAVLGANDGLWDWDIPAERVYYAPRWKAMLGYEEYEIGDSPEEWFHRIHPEDLMQVKSKITAHLKGTTAHFQAEYRMLHKDGGYRWELCRGLAVWDTGGTAYRFAGSQTDITDSKKAEQRLVQSAFYDDLTGLPNRALFVDHLHYAIELTKRYKERLFAVLFMDIDRFKDINDSLGHLAGDQLLVAIGKKLETILRPTDSVARLGGDEFVILLDDIHEISDATYIADRIQREISTSSLLPEHTAYVTASLGIVLSASGYDDPEDILRDADIAMYRAKGNGRARYEIFDTTMRDRILKRLNLENELRQAIEHGDLRVYFQPIASLSDNHLIGFEALVRWKHPERGIIPPLDFIPLAEETGMIILIDRWVMREACRQLREWQMLAPEFRSLTINVNLSGRQIAQPDLIETIAQVLKETGLEPRCLNLELTESVIMESFENTINVLSGLRELGVQIQIDDFGIGYSSLNYLSQFPLTALKIDRSFVRLMQRDQNHLKIIQAIVTLSHGLGIEVVAEGVETTTQLDQLKALGCQYIQGALISMPVDSEIARTFLDKPLIGEKSPD